MDYNNNDDNENNNYLVKTHNKFIFANQHTIVVSDPAVSRLRWIDNGNEHIESIGLTLRGAMDLTKG